MNEDIKHSRKITTSSGIPRMVKCSDIFYVDHESVMAHSASLLFNYGFVKVAPSDLLFMFKTESRFVGYRVNRSAFKPVIATIVFILILLIFLNSTPSSIISGYISTTIDFYLLTLYYACCKFT